MELDDEEPNEEASKVKADAVECVDNITIEPPQLSSNAMTGKF